MRALEVSSTVLEEVLMMTPSVGSGYRYTKEILILHDELSIFIHRLHAPPSFEMVQK